MAILIGFVLSVSLAFICVAIANSKGRNPWVWGILGFLFSFVALIVIAALPSLAPPHYEVEPSIGEGVRNCPQCDAENHLDSVYCSNCGASLGLAPDVDSRVVTSARFLTPLIGLVVGLVVALILLQATKLSAEKVLDERAGASQEALEQVRQELADMPPVVLFWPVSSELESIVTRQPARRMVWSRFPVTLQIMLMGGGLAVLLAWGLALGLRRRHPGITAGRMSVASLATMPLFWVGLMMLLVMIRYYEWSPPIIFTTLLDDPKNNLLQVIWPIYAIGIIGGLWTALEMRSRADASPWVVLARTLGLVLRHGGMLVSGVILLELLFSVPGLGRLLIDSAFRRDTAMLGASAAVFIWLALWSRFLGNLVLAAVGGIAPARTGALRWTESGSTLAIGAAVTLGLLALLFLLPFVASQDPRAMDLRNILVGPNGGHWFGTDQLGRDIFSRVLHGGRSAAVVGLPMAQLALLVGVPMVVARVVLDRSNAPGLVHGIEGALEGLVAVPWLVIGILIQANLGHSWPLVALIVVIIPRALRTGWALGAGERLQVIPLISVFLRLGALFLAVALAMSAALGFLGLGIQPPRPDLGLMLQPSIQYIDVAPLDRHLARPLPQRGRRHLAGDGHAVFPVRRRVPTSRMGTRLVLVDDRVLPEPRPPTPLNEPL